MKNKILFLLIALLLVSVGCNKWDYKHQDSWSRHYKECGTRYQSPVDIQTDLAGRDSMLAPLFTDYLPIDSFVVKRMRHQMVVTNLDGSVTAPDTNYWGHDYYLSRVMFHTPSEHTVNGKHYPAEIQFINVDTAGNLLVIAVFVKKGESNNSLGLLLANMPKKNGETVVANTLDLNKFLPFSASYWHYTGSLTYPPCTNNVQWFVMKMPVEASEQQLDSLRTVLGDNARDVQDLNGRKITEF